MHTTPVSSEHRNRALTAYEQFWEVLNTQYRSWSSSRVVKLRGRVDRELFPKAITALQRTHPRLSSRIRKSDDGRLCFSYGDAKIPVEYVVTEAFAEVITEQINRPLDSTVALLRIVLIQTPAPGACAHLVLIYHHAIADGLSILSLLEELMQCYERLGKGEACDRAPVDLELLPVEAFLDDAPAQCPLDDQKRREVVTLPFDRYVPMAERRSAVLIRTWSVADTADLVALSKQRRISMQGLLNAGLILAIARNLFQSSGSVHAEQLISCRVYVNLRPLLERAPAAITLHPLVSSVTVYHRISTQQVPRPDLVCAIAADSKRQLTAGLRDRAQLLSGFSTAVGDLEQLLAADSEVDVSASISTLRVDLPHRYGALDLDEIYPVSPQGVFRYPHLYVSTFRGRLHCVFCYSEPSHDRLTIERLAANFESLLHGAASAVDRKHDAYSTPRRRPSKPSGQGYAGNLHSPDRG